MFNSHLRLFDAVDDNEGSGGKPASERDAFGSGLGAGRAPERIGSISRSVEKRALAHTHDPSLAYPEGHVAGAPGVGMDPGIPYHRRRTADRTTRAASVAGNAAGTVVRWARNRQDMRDIRPEDARRNAEEFIVAHPASLAGAALAGFVLGRLLRR